MFLDLDDDPGISSTVKVEWSVLFEDGHHSGPFSEAVAQAIVDRAHKNHRPVEIQRRWVSTWRTQH